MKLSKKHLGLFITLFVLLIAGLRFMDLPYNFSPILALFLLCWVIIKDFKLKLIVPLCLVVLTDFIINNTSSREFFTQESGLVWMADYMIWNYVAYIFVGFLAYVLIKKINVVSVLGTSLLASVVFFLVTNFGSWLSDPMYVKDLTGLMSSYKLGVPFYRATLAGNIVFSSIFFGAYYVAKNYVFVEENELAMEY